MKKGIGILIGLKPEGSLKEHEESESKAEEKAEHSDTPPELEMIAEELLSAVKKGNVSAIAEALHAAFLVCDAAPHKEGEHEEEEEV